MSNITAIVKSACIIALFYFFSQSYAVAQETRFHDGVALNKSDSLSVHAPGAKLADKLYDKANSIFENTKLVHYGHLHLPAKDQINTEEGVATTDCSGFISYILQATAPRHYEAIRTFSTHGVYPKAETYASFFAQLDPQISHNGWRQVQFFKDLQRGDLIAWKKASLNWIDTVVAIQAM